MKSKHFYFIGIAALSFFLCLNAAYINGDDIAHVSGGYFFEIYFPYKLPDWIPNRRFDMWGRGFIAQVVDQGYYFLSSFVKNPLELSFKLTSAVFFALLILSAQKVVTDLLRVKRLAGKPEKFLVHLFVTACLLVFLPYINQVHLICYQLPSLLAFYFVANFQELKNPKISYALAFLLVYILAFSLESIGLILFIYSFICLVLLYLQSKKSGGNSNFVTNPIVHLLVFSLIVNAIAIFIAGNFSIRVGEATRGNLSITRIYESLVSTISIKYYLILLCVSAFLGLVGLMLRTKKIFGCFDSRLLLRLILISISCLFGVYLISVRIAENYLSPFVYPWGDMYLIAKFALLTLTLTLVIRFYRSGKILHYTISLVLFIAISGLTVKFLGFYEKQSKMAKSVWNVFERVEASKGGNVVITDFNANSIHGGLRPFPADDQNDPKDWFYSSYQRTFKKFLGVETPVHPIYR